MPAVVSTMLGHLDPQAGERILEIGTGTGGALPCWLTSWALTG
ncbi:MAG TPA: hypothetical protein VK887_09635 [Pseudonocardiaceae bacterium]|nr:hypothetical protein [Pseudonocardiaceae bacterium]